MSPVVDVELHEGAAGVAPEGAAGNGTAYPKLVCDPNDIIDAIVKTIDYAEILHDLQGLIEARRLLNNDLRQAIDVYVQEEVTRAVRKNALSAETEPMH